MRDNLIKGLKLRIFFRTTHCTLTVYPLDRTKQTRNSWSMSVSRPGAITVQGESRIFCALCFVPFASHLFAV